jgi:hypothetical protein
MMQWAALSLLAAAYALRVEKDPPPDARRSKTSTIAWRVGAAAAGAAVGTKYSAWPLVVLLMAARARTHSARAAIEMGVVAVAAFLVTTPGAVFQPVQFADGLQFQWAHYTTGHGQHSIPAGLPHLFAELRYLFTALWSPWIGPAIALAVLAVPGAVDLARRQRAAAILVVGFPVAYVCYLAAHRVFVVRNLIVTAPFLAVLTAWGAAACLDRIRSQRARAVVAVMLAGVVVADGAWLIIAAKSRVGGMSLRRFADDLRREGPLCATPSVVTAMALAGVELPANVVASCATTARVALYRADLAVGTLPASGERLTSYAPYEVNYAYYPDWIGPDPLLTLPVSRARALGARLP